METPETLTRAARRRALVFLAAGTVALAGMLAAERASAQDDYPSKPIRIIVPFPPGAITDTTGRMIAAELSKVIGQTVVVENRGGGGTVVGTQAAKAAPADGYTILYQLNSLATNVYSLKQPGYALTDFKPVSMFGEAAFVVVTSQQAPFKTLQAVMTGDVHFSLPTQSAPLIHANPDKLKILAITSKKRLDTLPDVPTFAELGYAIDEKTWFGLFVLSDTPPAAYEKLKAALAQVFNSPAMKEQLSKLRVSPYEGTLEDVPARLQRELDAFSQEAKKLGLEPQ